jgi:hypothetical protein
MLGHIVLQGEHDRADGENDAEDQHELHGLLLWLNRSVET